MKNANRDLLVLVKDAYTDKGAMEHELQQLNLLLLQFETLENFCIAHEVFDMNRYRIITSIAGLMKVVEKEEIRPFVFICNKN